MAWYRRPCGRRKGGARVRFLAHWLKRMPTLEDILSTDSTYSKVAERTKPFVGRSGCLLNAEDWARAGFLRRPASSSLSHHDLPRSHRAHGRDG